MQQGCLGTSRQRQLHKNDQSNSAVRVNGCMLQYIMLLY